MIRFALIPFVLLLLLAAACKNEENAVRHASDRITLSPPINGVDVPFSTLSVNAASGDQLTFRTGTKIAVPENAFVDALGKPVTGTVELYYREFHDAADIFLAGVPLDYDTASRKMHLTTAGMFEIQAMKGSEEVFLAPGKVVKVKMASWQPGLEYNFYRLQGKDLNWEFLGSSLPENNANVARVQEQAAARKREPVLDSKSQYFCFHYMAALDTYFDASRAEKGSNPKEIFGKKAKEYGLRFLNYPALEDVSFLGVDYPAALLAWKQVSGAAVPGYIDSSHRVLFLPKGRNYELKVLSPDRKIVSSSVIQPVMPLASLFAHPAAYWRGSFDEGMAEVVREVQRVKTEAAVYRFFEITRMGIYNWDKIKNENGSVQVAASFPIKGKNRSDYAFKRTAILFPGDNRSVIKLPESVWDSSFYVFPDPGARIAMILPGQQLAIFSPAAYSKIPFSQLQGKTIPPPYAFEMTMHNGSVATAADFRKALGF